MRRDQVLVAKRKNGARGGGGRETIEIQQAATSITALSPRRIPQSRRGGGGVSTPGGRLSTQAGTTAWVMLECGSKKPDSEIPNWG